METQKSDVRTTKTFLLRMSNNHYHKIKAESQRVNVSMTAMLNFIIDDYVTRQKLEENGTAEQRGQHSLRNEGGPTDGLQEHEEGTGQPSA